MAGSQVRSLVPVEAKNPEIGLLLGQLEAGHRNIREELGDVPDEAVVWQPYPNGHSIGAIIIHIAACEALWLHLVAAGQETPMDLEDQMMGGPSIDQSDGVWPAPPREPISWYYAQHDAIRARTLELVRELPDPAAVRPVAWSPGRECTVGWIIHRNIEHEAYHMGQAVLLRLMYDRMNSR